MVRCYRRGVWVVVDEAEASHWQQLEEEEEWRRRSNTSTSVTHHRRPIGVDVDEVFV
jgi:hypothetical protein